MGDVVGRFESKDDADVFLQLLEESGIRWTEAVRQFEERQWPFPAPIEHRASTRSNQIERQYAHIPPKV